MVSTKESVLPSVPMKLWSQHLASHYYLHIKLQLQVSKCHAWTTGPCFGQLHYIRHPASQCDTSKKVTWRGSPIGEQSWTGVLFKIVNKKLFLMHASRHYLGCPDCIANGAVSCIRSHQHCTVKHLVSQEPYCYRENLCYDCRLWHNTRTVKKQTEAKHLLPTSVHSKRDAYVLTRYDAPTRSLEAFEITVDPFVLNKESKLLRWDTRGSHP